MSKAAVWATPKNTNEAIDAFLKGYAFTQGRLHSDGTTLWSYGLAIARWTSKGLQVLDNALALKPNGEKSVTTVRHINKVRQANGRAKTVKELGR